MPEQIVVRDLSKIFGARPERALRMAREGQDKDEIYRQTRNVVGVIDADFTVAKGEIFVVMGLSGSGKSTLVRLLNRLIDPTDGVIEINGRDIARMSRKELIELRRREIGMVFQSFALMPHLTVGENAAFGLSVAGVESQERTRRAMKALETVGLDGQADRMPSELSGGMQQRVGLARALAQDPAVLLMDEAFSALDPLIRTEMQDELLRLQDVAPRTIVFISHDLDEAMRIGDRIAIMQAGRIVQIGRPDEIVREPANDYVRAFFRGVDVSQVFTAGDVASRRTGLTLIGRPGDGVRAAQDRLERNEADFAFVHDRSQNFRGVVSLDSLAKAAQHPDEALENAFLADIEPISSDTPLSQVLSRVAEAPCPVPVVDDRNRYLGTISKAGLLRVIDRATG